MLDYAKKIGDFLSSIQENMVNQEFFNSVFNNHFYTLT
jgi:hypothetical protein